MAAFTIHPELALVLILVACRASRPQAQEGPRSVLNFRLPQFIDVDEIDLVTIPALLTSVRSRKRIPCLAMIEPLLAVGPMHQLEITTNVVSVTSHNRVLGRLDRRRKRDSRASPRPFRRSRYGSQCT